MLRGLEEGDGEPVDHSKESWDDDDDASNPFYGSPTFMAACVAGFLHPYWYARGATLSFVCIKTVGLDLFTPFYRVGNGRIRSVRDLGGETLDENYTASSLIEDAMLLRVQAWLAKPDSAPAAFGEIFHQSARESLEAAVSYARERGLGLLEASDLIEPGGGSFMTNPQNLRTLHRKRREL
jgi:hypothetical protein